MIEVVRMFCLIVLVFAARPRGESAGRMRQRRAKTLRGKRGYDLKWLTPAKGVPEITIKNVFQDDTLQGLICRMWSEHGIALPSTMARSLGAKWSLRKLDLDEPLGEKFAASPADRKVVFWKGGLLGGVWNAAGEQQMCEQEFGAEKFGFVGSLHSGITGYRGCTATPDSQTCTVSVFPTDHGIYFPKSIKIGGGVFAIGLTAYHCAYNSAGKLRIGPRYKSRVAIGGDYLPEVSLTFGVSEVRVIPGLRTWVPDRGMDVAVLLLNDIQIGAAHVESVSNFPKEFDARYEHIRAHSPIIGLGETYTAQNPRKVVAMGYGRTYYATKGLDGKSAHAGQTDPILDYSFRNFLQCVKGVAKPQFTHVIKFEGTHTAADGTVVPAGTWKGDSGSPLVPQDSQNTIIGVLMYGQSYSDGYKSSSYSSLAYPNDLTMEMLCRTFAQFVWTRTARKEYMRDEDVIGGSRFYNACNGYAPTPKLPQSAFPQRKWRPSSTTIPSSSPTASPTDSPTHSPTRRRRKIPTIPLATPPVCGSDVVSSSCPRFVANHDPRYAWEIVAR